MSPWLCLHSIILNILTRAKEYIFVEPKLLLTATIANGPFVCKRNKALVATDVEAYNELHNRSVYE